MKKVDKNNFLFILGKYIGYGIYLALTFIVLMFVAKGIIVLWRWLF